MLIWGFPGNMPLNRSSLDFHQKGTARSKTIAVPLKCSPSAFAIILQLQQGRCLPERSRYTSPISSTEAVF